MDALETKDSSSLCIFDLSDEVLLLILEFLHPEDLTEVALTCHRLNAISSENSIWERYLCSILHIN